MEIIYATEAHKLSDKTYNDKENKFINIINNDITNACNNGEYECIIRFKEIVPERLIKILEQKGYVVLYDKVCHYQFDGYEDDKTAIKIIW